MMGREKDIKMSLAFTWSPDQKEYAHIINPRKQLCEHMRVLRILKNSCYYDIIAEPHTNGNLHYHGILQVFDKVKYYKQTLPTLKYHGFIYIKPNPDNGWVEYIYKNYKETEKVLKCTFPFTERHDITDSSPEPIDWLESLPND